MSEIVGHNKSRGIYQRDCKDCGKRFRFAKHKRPAKRVSCPECVKGYFVSYTFLEYV